MSCTLLLQCPRQCGSIRVCPGAECARSRGTRALWLRSTGLAGRTALLLRAGASTQHCPSSGMGSGSVQSSLSKMLHPKCSNDGEGCQAHGTTAATKRKRLLSEVINHPWCLVWTPRSNSSKMDNQTLRLLQSWGPADRAGFLPGHACCMWLTNNLMAAPPSSKPDLQSVSKFSRSLLYPCYCSLTQAKSPSPL